MYRVLDSSALLAARRRLAQARHEHRPLVARTVVLLGFTSLFTDISSEMVSAILPLYLVSIRGLDPLQFGVIDGIYQGGSAIVRVVFGYVADRLRRYRDVAAAGYGLSALSKLGLVLVGGAWTAIGGLVLADRIGKGIRTAPRDAMISLSSARDQLGLAFGVHRAMDTCGAMIGPLLAFALLAIAPDNFDGLFLISFCFALIGLAVLVFLVREPKGTEGAAEPPPHPTTREAARLVRIPRLRVLLAVTGVLSLLTVSDAFIYLELQRRIDFNASIFPLLYFGTALTFMLLAVPVGRLADRAGRERVFVGGYVVLLLVYVLVQAAPATTLLLLASMAMLGTYYAATDGVLAALGSALTPEPLRGTGLAVLGTVTGVGRFGASILFGAAWTIYGPTTALTVFSAALGTALVFTAFVMLARPGATA